MRPFSREALTKYVRVRGSRFLLNDVECNRSISRTDTISCADGAPRQNFGLLPYSVWDALYSLVFL